MTTYRLIRVPLPASLVQEMDNIIRSGEGGFESREEFVREAVEAAVMEARYGIVQDQLAAPAAAAEPTPGLSVVSSPAVFVASGGDDRLGRTALRRPVRPEHFAEPVARVGEHEPQFGLHNRDYPSLWAGARLCDLTSNGPASFEPMLKDLISEAWEFADYLEALDRQGVPGKPSALFPTNKEKRQASEGAFAQFAVGTLTRDKTTGAWRASGPLFDWGVLGLVEQGDSTPKVGITEAGFDLLCDMEGLDVSQPHGERWALRFLSHLDQHSPADREGFSVILEGASRSCSRSELVEIVRERWSQWSAVEASTNAAGYVARGREWGLLEPRQYQGTYRLTDFGRQVHDRQAS
jgi:Arc/MetJ-type ribon-helix-helix transcriptional regulator